MDFTVFAYVQVNARNSSFLQQAILSWNGHRMDDCNIYATWLSIEIVKFLSWRPGVLVPKNQLLQSLIELNESGNHTRRS